MRRLIKTVFLVAVFMGGYYLGGLPGRPDIIGWAGGVWSGIDRTTREISSKAQREQKSLPEAAISYALRSTPEPAANGN
jgi:hypothetical protein